MSQYWYIIIKKSILYIRVLCVCVCVVHSMGLDKYIITGIHHCSITQNSFTAHPHPPSPPVHPTPSACDPQATTDPFAICMVVPFSKCHLVGISLYVAFSDWLLSLNNKHLSFLHIFLWLGNSFLFVAEECSIEWYTTFYLFIHQFEDILVVSKCWKSWVWIWFSCLLWQCGQRDMAEWGCDFGDWAHSQEEIL